MSKPEIGELAFEHGFGDGEVVDLYRVVYWRGWSGRRVRCTDFYADESEAEARINRINESPDHELISIIHYKVAPRSGAEQAEGGRG